MVDPDAAPETVPLGELLREDLERHDGKVLRPGFQAVAVHRLGRRAMRVPGPGGRVATQAAKLAQAVVRNVYGIEVGFTVELGRRVKIAHQGVLVVHDRCRIGNDCLLRHGATLGARTDDDDAPVPVLEDGVEVGVNAVVIGGIVLGEGARIGAGAVVIEDVPAGAMALAAPATIRLPRRPTGEA